MSDETWLEARSVAVISDLHMGAGTCVLDLPGSSDGLGGLTRFLEENKIEVDAFILMGDIFDLALATYQATVTRAKALVEVISKHCKKIVFLPGNHDHHLWLLANDAAEIADGFPQCPDGFSRRAELSYLDSFIGRIAPGFAFQVSYPNAYWRPANGDARTVVFHHGHFCEDTYTMLSDIYRDGFDGITSNLNALEAINAGWVEMVWYHLGQGGTGFGGFVKSLYNQLSTGMATNLEGGIRRLYQRKASPLVHASFADLAREHWWLPNRAAEWAAEQIDRRAPDWIMAAVRRAIVTHVEEGAPAASGLRNAVLDDALAGHCKRYMDLTANTRGDLGSRLAFVFGHTHRFGKWPETRPFLFNDGGWTTDDPATHWPDSYLFHIDESANLRALRFGKDGETIGRETYPLV